LNLYSKLFFIIRIRVIRVFIRIIRVELYFPHILRNSLIII